jgi:quercetin dioxygenase-like cupin family protein
MKGPCRKAEMKTRELAPGITIRTISCGERAQMIRFDVKKGAQIPVHSHPHEQIGYLARGKLLMFLENEEFEVNEGDGYSVGPNAEHGGRALEDSIAIDVFAPPREDYR